MHNSFFLSNQIYLSARRLLLLLLLLARYLVSAPSSLSHSVHLLLFIFSHIQSPLLLFPSGWKQQEELSVGEILVVAVLLCLVALFRTIPSVSVLARRLFAN